MHNSVYHTLLSARQEVSYLSTYIGHYRQHYLDTARIELHTSVSECYHRVEHDMLLPLINDAFRFGILQVQRPVILFDMQLDKHSFTFGMHYCVNRTIHDERTQVTFMKLKRKLESLYPGMHILHRDHHNDTYLVFVQILF
jgi:two-component system, LytTR family, sensor kinase